MISSSADLPRKGLVECEELGDHSSFPTCSHHPHMHTHSLLGSSVSLSPLLIVWAVSEPLLGIVCAIRGVKGEPQK